MTETEAETETETETETESETETVTCTGTGTRVTNEGDAVTTKAALTTLQGPQRVAPPLHNATRPRRSDNR